MSQLQNDPISGAVEMRTFKTNGRNENVAAAALLGSREGSRSNLFQSEPKFDSSLLATELKKNKSNEALNSVTNAFKKTTLAETQGGAVKTSKPLAVKALLEILAKTPTEVLLLDVRPLQDFEDMRIKDSANISLPSLILKRIKKGTAGGNFQLDNFLTNTVSKERYKAWFQNYSDAKNAAIVVYDEDISQIEDVESDAYAVLKAILGSQLVATKQNLTVNYLDGGLNAMIREPAAHPFMEGNQQQQQVGTGVPGIITVVPSLTSEALTLSPTSATSNYETPMLTIQGSSPVSTTFESATQPTPSSIHHLDSPHKSMSLPVQSSGSPLLTSPVSKPSKRSSFTISIAPSPSASSPSNGPITPSMAEASTPAAPQMEHISQITDYMFLGSEVVPTASDAVAQLSKKGITHVLNMAKEVKDEPLMSPGSGIEFKWIGVYDHPDEEIEGPIRQGVQFIDDARKKSPEGTKVLVHCKAGRSRSVAVVLAYLVMVQKMTLRDAYSLVSEKRKGIIPNIGFMVALLHLELEVHGKNTEILGPSALQGTRSI
ncbi:hypothetical protein HDU79_011059 [Rhizoclosmatium sp. JEL0117]|nr:hypothetical protein HDU79_011059 [Rhizoclosmatium sp. JEL0117]